MVSAFQVVGLHEAGLNRWPALTRSETDPALTRAVVLEPRVWEYRVPVLPELPNRKGQGHHWSREARYRKSWHWLVRCAVGNVRPAAPLAHARVVLTRHSRRAPDPDNLAASWKPVLDGLVRARVLLDDSPAHVELASRWERWEMPEGRPVSGRGAGHISLRVEGISTPAVAQDRAGEAIASAPEPGHLPEVEQPRRRIRGCSSD